MRLTRDLLVSEGSFAAASTGTVVNVHKEGAAFEIEFTAPIQAVVTIESADLERLND